MHTASPSGVPVTSRIDAGLISRSVTTPNRLGSDRRTAGPGSIRSSRSDARGRRTSRRARRRTDGAARASRSRACALPPLGRGATLGPPSLDGRVGRARRRTPRSARRAVRRSGPPVRPRAELTRAPTRLRPRHAHRARATSVKWRSATSAAAVERFDRGLRQLRSPGERRRRLRHLRRRPAPGRTATETTILPSRAHEPCLPRPRGGRALQGGRPTRRPFLEATVDAGRRRSGGEEARDLVVGEAPELAALRRECGPGRRPRSSRRRSCGSRVSRAPRRPP